MAWTYTTGFEAVPDTVHALPDGDLVLHEPVDDCVCGPDLRPVLKDDGTFWWKAIHHPLLGERFK